MFEVYKSAHDKKYYFRLRARNGETILQSQGYARPANCMKGIAAVKKSAANRSAFEQRTSADGKFYFVVKAANSKVVGSSQMYASPEGVTTGIESVGGHAPDAEVVTLRKDSQLDSATSLEIQARIASA
jgi:uncharacterized protein